jgi:hypothetical protein
MPRPPPCPPFPSFRPISPRFPVPSCFCVSSAPPSRLAQRVCAVSVGRGQGKGDPRPRRSHKENARQAQTDARQTDEGGAGGGTGRGGSVPGTVGLAADGGWGHCSSHACASVLGLPAAAEGGRSTTAKKKRRGFLALSAVCASGLIRNLPVPAQAFSLVAVVSVLRTLPFLAPSCCSLLPPLGLDLCRPAVALLPVLCRATRTLIRRIALGVAGSNLAPSLLGFCFFTPTAVADLLLSGRVPAPALLARSRSR